MWMKMPKLRIGMTAAGVDVDEDADFTCGLTCAGDLDVQLTLDSQGYSGTLTPLLSQLTQLVTLDVGENHFHGPAPRPHHPRSQLQQPHRPDPPPPAQSRRIGSQGQLALRLPHRNLLLRVDSPDGGRARRELALRRCAVVVLPPPIRAANRPRQKRHHERLRRRTAGGVGQRARGRGFELQQTGGAVAGEIIRLSGATIAGAELQQVPRADPGAVQQGGRGGLSSRECWGWKKKMKKTNEFILVLNIYTIKLGLIIIINMINLVKISLNNIDR